MMAVNLESNILGLTITCRTDAMYKIDLLLEIIPSGRICAANRPERPVICVIDVADRIIFHD